MFIKKQEKKIHKPGGSQIYINILTQKSHAQQEIHYKQTLKQLLGGISEQTLKSKNLNQQNYLKNILIKLNVAHNSFQAQHLIKEQHITINKKHITNPNYWVNLFSFIQINTTYKELTLLKNIKKQNLNNINNFINSKLIYKTNPFNLNPLLKKFILT